jgi:hypothetical protein
VTTHLQENENKKNGEISERGNSLAMELCQHIFPRV